MSGPTPPDHEPSDQPGARELEEYRGDRDELTDTGFSRAYSAPESEQYNSAPYLPADLELYDYDSYQTTADGPADLPPPRWPWVVGVTAIVAAIALVASVSLLVTRTRARIGQGSRTRSASRSSTSPSAIRRSRRCASVRANSSTPGRWTAS